MFPVAALVISTLFTWAVAIWTTFEEEHTHPFPHEKEQNNQKKPKEAQYPDWRNAA